MKKIASFTVDHRYITPGVYLSRVDGDITTYDLRFTKPNAGEYLDYVTIHSVEHLFATYVRNSALADSVIYFGPMGCRTGFYLLVRTHDNSAAYKLILDVLAQIVAHDGEMFGATEIECGNYRELCVDSAKSACKRYLDVLNAREMNFNYPGGEA